MATISRDTEAPRLRKKTSKPDRPDRRERTRRVGLVSGSWWWTIPAVALVVGIIYISIGAGTYYAFTSWDGVGPAKFNGLANFRSIFADPITRKALINTFEIAFAFLILTNIFGMLFALALNRTLKTRHFLRVVLFAPVVLSPLAVSYVWQFIFQVQGAFNKFLGVFGLKGFEKPWLGDPHYAIYTIIIVMVWQHIGLVMVIYLAGLANVPPEIEEAAVIDGAGVWRRFWYITVFQIRPSIVIASVLMLITGLKVFDQVIGLTGGGPYNATETLATQVYKQTFTNGQFGYGDALSLILTVVVIVFSLLQVALLRNREVN